MTGQRAPAASPSSTSAFPSTFFTGPAGANNILPPNGAYPAKGAFLGLTVGGSQFTYAQALQQMRDRDRFFGRKLDIQQRFLNGTCQFDAVLAKNITASGWIPMFTWSPPGFTDDQIANGAADSCIRTFGRGLASWGKPMFLRMYHEFDGDWFPYSYNPSNPQVFVVAWRRTVDILNAQGVKRVSFVWSPHEGKYSPSRPSGYPGDAYVDWVSSDSYNRNNDASCGLHAGWCPFEDIFHATGWVNGGPVQCTPGQCVETDFRGVKPYMVSEYGSLEDVADPGRKGVWHQETRKAVKDRFPGLYALVYFDMDLRQTEGENWRLDSSRSSLDGFKALAEDPYFNTRVPCVAGYSPCLRPGRDLDCGQIADSRKPLRVRGNDPYELDPDRRGLACQVAGKGGGILSPWGLILRKPARVEAMSARVGTTLAVVGWSPPSFKGAAFRLCPPATRRCVVANRRLNGIVQTLGTWRISRAEGRRGRFRLSLEVNGKVRAFDTVPLR
jgi:hypothetical protein